MKFAEPRPYADPEAAMQKVLEIASTVEPVQDGRIHIEKINGPFLFEHGGKLAEYTAGAAAAARPGLRRGVRIELPDLVVEAGGHLRAYTGRALLPALLLAGVAPADIH